ncbi:MAG: bifunctional 4-hydroxy-2-oxoglutarate aldolase/2-dehydro-3-deoxy-phosphogluconate aldolase [Lachnospiraceae bacterium]|nr:bifunctional 4-hydroxy-2-oxoglutarate aldolase/2-dehydro-3-deoxy-phosphogluconate aldolase [Lachnospiraceae bacterium]
MNDVIKKIEETKIIPVVVIEDVKYAERLADALCDGGIKCAEVTFRTDSAKEAIKVMTKTHPDMFVGAGTVTTKKQVDDAIDAGASYIVSPGLNPDIVEYCQQKGITIIPGVMTPSEVELALGLGLEVVKFFPAEAAGGLKMIKAISAPYSNVRFIPTGGINTTNVGEYLSFPKVIACGGSWMVSKDLINGEKFEDIKMITAAAAKRAEELK